MSRETRGLRMGLRKTNFSSEGTFVLSEKQIQRQAVDFLRAEGWRVFEFEQQWSEKKRKTVGEKGMPDVMATRYCRPGLAPNGEWVNSYCLAEVLWIEFKRFDRRGKSTKASVDQLDWHRRERKLGALTLIAGIDFLPTIEGFIEFMKKSGLCR